MMSIIQSPSVSAVVVTYHPDDLLAQRIEVLKRQVRSIWIVDNGSPSETVNQLRKLESEADGAISLITNLENQGLAAGQNQGVTAAMSRGCDWVLLMDQDSEPDQDMVSEMLSAAREYPSPERIGFLAPRHDDERGLPASWVYIRQRWSLLGRRAIATGQVEDRTAFVMASGCLVSRERIMEIGPMREEFFIDYIDYDFSFRVRRAGYRIVVVGSANLKHRLGEHKEAKFLGFKKSFREHQADRRHTIYRNRIRVIFSHGFRFPEFLQFEFLSITKDFAQLLIWESEKGAKLSAILSGIWAGLLGRGGIRKS
jgi:rhamnosyltransferase